MDLQNISISLFQIRSLLRPKPISKNQQRNPRNMTKNLMKTTGFASNRKNRIASDLNCLKLLNDYIYPNTKERNHLPKQANDKMNQ